MNGWTTYIYDPQEINNARYELGPHVTQDDVWNHLAIRWRDDEEDGRDELTRLPLVEMYGQWSNAFGLPIDLQVGLQDFDEDRRVVTLEQGVVHPGGLGHVPGHTDVNASHEVQDSGQR